MTMVRNGRATEAPPSSSTDLDRPLPLEGPLPEEARIIPHHAYPGRSELNPYIDRVAEISDQVVSFLDAYELRGRWNTRFPAQAPLFLELGAGYGQFLAGIASKKPAANFIGLELRFKRLYRAALRASRLGLTNIQWVRFDALLLDQIFAPGEIAGLYINYPDPWPKGRHADRRMISRRLVEQCARILVPGASVYFKSDWAPYREIAREVFEGSPFRLVDAIEDLRRWGREEENIETGYEKRFLKEGRSCFFYEYRYEGGFCAGLEAGGGLSPSEILSEA